MSKKLNPYQSALSPAWFFAALALLFIGLKLMDYIDWPWVWVLAPLWALLCLAGIVACVTVMVIVLLAIFVKDKP